MIPSDTETGMSLCRILCPDLSVLLFYNAFCKRQPDSGAVFSRILPSVKPVSYTHLDVYKRQI